MIWQAFPSDLKPISHKLYKELNTWKNTKYLLGGASKKYGVDCVRFCCRVADFLFGFVRCDYGYLPQDTCFHNKETAFSAMRTLRELYNPLADITDDAVVQPADLLVVGPKDGGPGHLQIVGPEQNTIWHVTMNGPAKAGLTLPDGYRLFRAYRFGNRELWVPPA